MHVHMYVYYVYITSKDTHLFSQLSIFIVYSLLGNMLGAIGFIPLRYSPRWLGTVIAFRWACFLWYLITNRGQITPKDLEMCFARVICKSLAIVGVPFKIISLFNSICKLILCCLCTHASVHPSRPWRISSRCFSTHFSMTTNLLRALWWASYTISSSTSEPSFLPIHPIHEVLPSSGWTGNQIAFLSQMCLVQQLMASSVVYAWIIEPSGQARLWTYLFWVGVNLSYLHIWCRCSRSAQIKPA